jgi:hypothetical protein
VAGRAVAGAVAGAVAVMVHGIMRMYTIDYIAIHSVDDDVYVTDHQKVGDVFQYSVAEIIQRYIRRIWAMWNQ